MEDIFNGSKKLGFGLMRLPLLNQNEASSIDIELTKKMVDTFIEKGFTYFDTAWMYCGFKSENAAKEALVDRHNRDEYTLATKLHSDFQGFAIDDEKMLPVYKACMARDLPILFHMGDARSELSAPKKLANVLEKLPELKCIAAHLGGYQRWDEAKACLKGANVWVDTSSSLFVLNPDEARRSIEHFGMDKVMFGTDFPMWTHKKELERFFALGYGEDENRKMLYDNFEKLFKL